MTEVPKSGSMKTSAKSTPTIARGLKGSLEPEGRRATAQLSRSTAASLANSAGCTVMRPRSSHLRAPLIRLPTPGMRTSTSPIRTIR